MKLAVLGAVAILIGLALAETGLVAIGALWVLLGPIMRRYGRRISELRSAPGQPAIDGRTFAVGTLLWFVLGVPSLLVGLLQPGITPENADWRWLPLVVGGLALGVGGLAGLMYGLSSAMGAMANLNGPEKPTAMETHGDQPIRPHGDSGPSREVSARLAELDQLHRLGQITDEEHRAQRERILGSI